MQNEKILFISNEIFINTKNKEGGVQFCTLEFIELLKTKFEVLLFPVRYKHSLWCRLLGKLDYNIYNDYYTDDYKEELKRNIISNEIKYIFLNLSNTMRFSKLLKDMFFDNIKIIICSHGNDTGDYIHEIVKFKFSTPWYKQILSSLILGKRLKLESEYRQNYIDLVLCVSPVEENIEKWIGSKHTFMVPRTITVNKIELKPELKRVGFIGDLSHWPNKYGIEEICKALKKQSYQINLRLVGTHENTGNKLAKEYPFVDYLGFMSNDALEKEAATWTFFLNPVFYYSKGVSTKLAKALGWGIPVISTSAGLRGYEWKEGDVIIAKDAPSMARLIMENAKSLDSILHAQKEIQKIVSSSPSFIGIMNQLYPLLTEL